jgi:copper transport protein
MMHSIRKPAMVRRILVAWGVAALVASISVATALAHANVVRSEPPDGGAVDQAPQEIRLWFSEPISPLAVQARVLDRNGQPVPSTEAQVAADDPTLLVVTVPDLPDGIYNVAYSVLSTDDGHASQGHLVFSIGGAAAGQTAPAAASEPPVPLAEVILRWLNYLALASLGGAIAVAFVLLRPRASSESSPGGDSAANVAAAFAVARRRVLRWALVSAVAALLLGLGLLLWEASVLALLAAPGATAGRSIGEVVAALLGQLSTMLISTRSGWLWVLREALLAIIAVLLFFQRGRSWPASRGAGMVLGLLAVAVIAIQANLGHAAAVKPETSLAVALDIAHLIAASLWVGGLLALAIGLLPLLLAGRGTPAYAALAHAAWGPFGALAALSVGVLIATGLYNTGQEVASLDGLLTTLYGRILIAKVVLVLGVGFFGLLNSTMLHPSLTAPLAKLLRRPAGWTPLSLRRLPLLIVAELGVGLAVLLATGTMVTTSPPHGPGFDPAPAVATTVTVPSQQVDDLLFTFEARPNQPGQNIALLQVVSTRRPPPAEIMRVIVHFTFRGQDIGTQTADAQEIAPGEYQLAGEQLSLAGLWQVDVVARRRGIEDTKASFQWTVLPPPIRTRPVVFSNRPLGPILTVAAALLLAGIAALAAAAVATRSRRRRPRTGGRPAHPADVRSG